MERKDIYIELLDLFMRGELPAGQEHELWTWFKQPRARELLFQHYYQSWTEAEGKDLPVEKSDVPEYSEPDTCRNREKGKARTCSKATVSPVVTVCRSCSISFRFYDFCSSISELG